VHQLVADWWFELILVLLVPIFNVMKRTYSGLKAVETSLKSK